MTSTMSFRGLVRQDSQDSNSRTGSLKKKLWHRHSISKGSLKSRNGENSAVTAGRRQVPKHTFTIVLTCFLSEFSKNLREV